MQRRLKIYSSFDSSSRCWVNGQHGNCSWKKKNISESLAGFVIDFPSCSPHVTNFSEIGDGILFSQLRRRVSLQVSLPKRWWLTGMLGRFHFFKKPLVPG